MACEVLHHLISMIQALHNSIWMCKQHVKGCIWRRRVTMVFTTDVARKHAYVVRDDTISGRHVLPAVGTALTSSLSAPNIRFMKSGICRHSHDGDRSGCCQEARVRSWSRHDLQTLESVSYGHFCLLKALYVNILKNAVTSAWKGQYECNYRDHILSYKSVP